MRQIMAVLAALAAMAGVPRGQAPEPIPIDQEPRHRVVFTTDRLRVLEVHIPAGDLTLEHWHDQDLATVNIVNGPTRTRDRGADWGGVRPREIGSVNLYDYTGKPVAHAVQSVGDRPYRLTGVENRRAQGWSTLAAIAASDLEMVAESRAFRAYRARLGPGASVSHRHEVPVVVTLVEGAATLPSSRERMLTAPGQWAVADAGVAHAVTAGTAGAHLVEIEVR